MLKIVKAVRKVKQDNGGVVGNLALSRTPSAKLSLKIRNIQVDPVALRKNRVLRGDEMESATMAFNMLRTQVYKAMTAKGWTSIGITSANKGEGKSLTALNFAYSLARSVQQSVILIDLDLRRPSIEKKLNIQPGVGMGDYFTKGVALTDILFTPDMDDFYIGPGHGSLDNASELLATGKLVNLMNELKQLFPSRFVVFDLPPILLVDDVLVASEFIDCMLLVATHSITKKEELSRSLSLLESNNLLGVVFNQSEETGSGGGYYNYYYGSDYRE